MPFFPAGVSVIFRSLLVETLGLCQGRTVLSVLFYVLKLMLQITFPLLQVDGPGSVAEDGFGCAVL